jgi:hypothetical protein
MGIAIQPTTGTNGVLNVVPTTGTTPRSAVQEATDAARAAIAANGTALPPDPATLPPRIGAGVPEGGQFTQSTVKPLAEPSALATPPAPPVAPEAGQPAPVAPPAPTEGQAPPAPIEGAGEPVDDPLMVELPIAIGEGEEPFMLQAADEETATKLREFVESSVSANEAALRLDAAQGQLQEFEEFREACDVDPDGVALGLVRDDPNAAARLVLSILADHPQVHQALAPKLAALADPAKRPQVILDARLERDTASRQADQALTRAREVRQNLSDVEIMLAAVVQDVPANLQKRAYQDLRRDIGDYAAKNRLFTLPLSQFKDAVAERLTDLGLDPEASAAKATVALARKGGSTPAGRPALRAPTFAVARQAAPTVQRTPPKPATVPVARKDGAAFMASAGRRRAVPAIPTGGAGSPGQPAPLAAPRNADGSVMSTEETIKWHRAEIAKGNRHY